MYGSLARLPLLQLLDGAQNAQPHGFPLPVAGFKKGIGALGSMSRRIDTVLVDQKLAGMTGSFVVPGVPYLQALALPRDALIQAMGILFTISMVSLAVSLGDHRLLSMELGALSTGAIIPALIGMVVGQKVRQRLSETAFRKVFFISLLLLGVYIVLRSIF